MKHRIEDLQGKIGKLMQEHLAQRDFWTVTVLSPLLTRTQDLEKRNNQLEQDFAEIESTLKAINGKRSSQPIAEILSDDVDVAEARARPHTLRIKIDWRAVGRSRDLEEIFQHTAAASVVTFVTRIIEEFGDDALNKLTRLRLNRGPFLSKTPATDFLNPVQGKLYGHKRLPGTDFYILTHSSTSQKVKDLIRVCRLLGFAPGSVIIEKIDRREMYQ